MIVPPVKLIAEVSILNNETPCPTLFAATPPALPSTIMLPPVWLKVLVDLWITFPLTVSVPPETVLVPLLAKTALLFEQPTVKSPEALTKVPPSLIVTPAALFPVELTVTICPEAIVTMSLQEGAPLGDQVAASFQSPEAFEIFVTAPCNEETPTPT